MFYKMYYNIRPGLGLHYVIVVYPDHTHLFFWSLVEKEYKCTTADTKCPRETVSFFSFSFCLNTCVAPPTPTL